MKNHDNSPTWPIVLEFAERMESKLERNRHKGDRDGWLKDDPWALWNRIGDELAELADAMDKKSAPEQIANECADIANFAMMVADRVTYEKESNAKE